MAFDVRALTNQEVEQLRLRLGLPQGGDSGDLIVKQSRNERDHKYESAEDVVDGVVGGTLAELSEEDRTVEERLCDIENKFRLLIFWMVQQRFDLPMELVKEIEKLDRIPL